MKAIICFFLLSFSLSAQVTGTIINKEGKAVPFVNIWVEGENIGTTSGENGFFKINASATQTVVFSSVGYEVKKTAVKDNEKIVLTDVVYKLDEVVISKRKNLKELEIGDMQRIHHKQLSGDKPWIYGKLFDYDSVYKATPFLKKIVFYSDSDIKDAKLKIRLFDFDSIPTNDLIDEDIIVTVKRGFRKNVVDVSKYNLKFPQNGIVIGLEWMIIESNRSDFEYKQKGIKKRVTMEDYAPSLVVNYSKKENSFSYSGGKWYRNKIFVTDKNDQPWYNTVMMPAINLILTN